MASPHAPTSLAARVRQWQVWTLPPPARVFVLAVVVLDWALTLAALAVAAPRVSLSHLGLYLALLGCGAVVVEAIRTVKEPKGTDTHDLMGIWWLPIAVLFPPGYAFLGPLLVEGYRLVRVRKVFPYRRVFSAATMSLGWGAASILFHSVPASIGGPAPRSGAHAVTWLLLAIGCALVAWLINVGLVLLAIRLATPGVPLRDAFGGRTGWVSDLIELSAAVTVTLAVTVEPLVLALILPPVFIGQRSLMNAQVDSQTRTDAQSGVLASAIWRYEADVEVYQAQRAHRPLVVALAEVDDFASMGGLEVPDAESQVLRAVATILADKLPPAAQVGRLRGAQFAVVLPGVAEEEARQLGMRIRDYLAAEPVEVERDGQLEFVARPTVSIGVAGLSEARHTVTELIAAADEALAAARAHGGNRVSVAPGGQHGPDPGLAQTPAG